MPSFVAAGATDTGVLSVEFVDAPLPAGWSAGQFAVAVAVGRPGTGAGPETPGGWTLRNTVRREVGAQDLEISTYYRWVPPEGCSFRTQVGEAYGNVGGGGGLAVHILTFADVNLASPFDDGGGATNTGAAASSWSGAPGVTTAVDLSLVVSSIAQADATTTFYGLSPAAGFVVLRDSDAQVGTTSGSAGKTQSPAGAVTMPTWVSGSGAVAEWVGITFALRHRFDLTCPAGGPGTLAVQFPEYEFEEDVACADLSGYSPTDFEIESDVDCAGLAGYQGGGFEIEVSEGGPCRCCPCRCECCADDGGYWEEYTFTVSGVGAGAVNPPGACVPNPCSLFNGTWVVTYLPPPNPECIWLSPTIVLCPGPAVFAFWELGCDGTKWTLTNQCATYEATLAEFDCRCGGTFALVGTPTCCGGWPSSITVEPVFGSTWVPCGTLTPPTALSCGGSGPMTLAAADAGRAARRAAQRAEHATASVRVPLHLLRPPCRYQGDPVGACRTCGGESAVIRYCDHPDDGTGEYDRCTRGPNNGSDPLVRSCLDCPGYLPAG